MKRSTTHTSIESTKDKLEGVHENSDSNMSDNDDDDWDKKCMWKSAIEVRKMAIYDNIVENFEDEESEEAEIEEVAEHQHYGKRSREDDELPDLKRHKFNHLNYRNYNNPLAESLASLREQLRQAQEEPARQYIPM